MFYKVLLQHGKHTLIQMKWSIFRESNLLLKVLFMKMCHILFVRKLNEWTKRSCLCGESVIPWIQQRKMSYHLLILCIFILYGLWLFQFSPQCFWHFLMSYYGSLLWFMCRSCITFHMLAKYFDVICVYNKHSCCFHLMTKEMHHMRIHAAHHRGYWDTMWLTFIC